MYFHVAQFQSSSHHFFSFTHSFIHQAHQLIYSLFHPFTHSFTRLFIYSSIQPFIYSFDKRIYFFNFPLSRSKVKFFQSKHVTPSSSNPLRHLFRFPSLDPTSVQIFHVILRHSRHSIFFPPWISPMPTLTPAQCNSPRQLLVACKFITEVYCSGEKKVFQQLNIKMFKCKWFVKSKIQHHNTQLIELDFFFLFETPLTS